MGGWVGLPINRDAHHRTRRRRKIECLVDGLVEEGLEFVFRGVCEHACREWVGGWVRGNQRKRGGSNELL